MVVQATHHKGGRDQPPEKSESGHFHCQGLKHLPRLLRSCPEGAPHQLSTFIKISNCPRWQLHLRMGSSSVATVSRVQRSWSDSLNVMIHMTIIILIHHPLAGLYILIASLKTLSSINEHCQPDFIPLKVRHFLIEPTSKGVKLKGYRYK